MADRIDREAFWTPLTDDELHDMDMIVLSIYFAMKASRHPTDWEQLALLIGYGVMIDAEQRARAVISAIQQMASAAEENNAIRRGDKPVPFSLN